MICGIGTDICKISRMRKATANDHFVRRIFSDEEIAYASSKGDPAKHYASAFAAKEALAKAGGWGVMKMGLRSTWIERTDNGPVIKYDEAFAALMAARGIKRCWLSLSHDGDIALAFVVLEG